MGSKDLLPTYQMKIVGWELVASSIGVARYQYGEYIIQLNYGHFSACTAETFEVSIIRRISWSNFTGGLITNTDDCRTTHSDKDVKWIMAVAKAIVDYAVSGGK